MRQTGDLLSIWLADGTNYAGQDDIRDASTGEAGRRVYRHRRAADADQYKFFEPAFYHRPADRAPPTPALKLRPQAQVLVDTSHRARANIAHVAILLDEGKLGGFTSTTQTPDDGLIVGVAPFELFTVFCGGQRRDWPRMWRHDRPEPQHRAKLKR